MTNGSTKALVVDHDFTEQEREGEYKAYYIRRAISNLLIISSIAIAVFSYIILHRKGAERWAILRVAMYFSAAIAIILLLVNGIQFIPGPPIR